MQDSSSGTAGAVGGTAALLSFALIATGCASAPWRGERVRVSAQQLLAGAPLGVATPAAELVGRDEVLALSEEMRDFLDRQVERGGDSELRLWRLTRALIGEGEFELEYDETTRSAAATFEARRGNCLSFSNMFVAMARDLGLEAHYQEVDTPPDWSRRNDAFVLNRHVNVLIDLGTKGERVVDFNVDDFRTSYDRRRISDSRALAHHWNNLAVERMHADDTAAALAYFRRALESDLRFSPAWTNLATLYLRGSHTDHAEAGYLRALEADERELVAMSNLAKLYERRGDRRRADAYRQRVARHRERNPYYRFWLARQAFEAGQHDVAIRHLEYAIRKKDDEDQFYFLLGKSYLAQGDRREAERWLARTEELAGSDAFEQRYASEIDQMRADGRERDEPRP